MTDQVVQTKEEVTGTSEPGVVKTTTTKVVQPVVGDNPQKVFQTKKTIFQFNNIVWYISGLIEVLVLARFVLEIVSTSSSGFNTFIYNITNIFVMPFAGIIAPSTSGSSTFEWAAVISMIVILVITLLIIYLVDLVRPVSPEQIRDSE